MAFDSESAVFDSSYNVWQRGARNKKITIAGILLKKAENTGVFVTKKAVFRYQTAQSAAGNRHKTCVSKP